MKVPKKRRGVSRQSAFLAAFALCGRISKAADAAGHERDLHYRWLKDDPDYPALFAEAKARAVDAFEDEAKRRAVEGVFEPTTHQGAFVYPVIGYRRDAKGRFDPTKPIHSKTPYGVMKLSDRLLEFLLRGAKPETYREARTVEISGPGGGPIALQLVERLNAARKRLAKPEATLDPVSQDPQSPIAPDSSLS